MLVNKINKTNKEIKMNDMNRDFPSNTYVPYIERIERSFGKKYETEMINCIIKVLKELPIDYLKYVIEDLIMRSRYFPKVPDWIESASKVSKDNYEKLDHGCSMCLGSTWVIVGKVLDSNFEKSYRCKCSVSSSHVKQWGIDLFNKGYYLMETHNWSLNPAPIREKLSLNGIRK